MNGTQPADCPKSPPRLGVANEPDEGWPCSLEDVSTGSEIIKMVTQCSRCGWIDPRSLDRWAMHWYKSRINGQAARTALAATGEPFTFVRTSERDLNLDEAIAQALAAASMAWSEEPTGQLRIDRAREIQAKLKAYVLQQLLAEHRGAVAEILRNTH